VVIKLSYFIHFIKKKFICKLGLGATDSFEGVGVVAVAFASHPKSIFILSPVFYSPNDDANTISTRRLKKDKIFKTVIERIYENLIITTFDDRTHTVPFEQQGELDYIRINIHAPCSPPMRAHTITHFECGPPPEYWTMSTKEYASPLWTMYLHLRWGHQHIDRLQAVIDRGIIKVPAGFPKKLSPLDAPCPICKIGGAVRLSRGPVVDTMELPVGTLFHIDFTFFDKVSIRGFTSAIRFVEKTTRRKWSFPGRNKRPPLAILRYFVNHMRALGYSMAFIRVNEAGEIARSEAVMRLCYEELNIVVQTTGGYNSTNNGPVESPNRPDKRMIRMMLMTANLPSTFWCFSLQYCDYIANNSLHSYTKRVPCHHMCGTAGILPPAKMPIFGSKMSIIKQLKSLRALSARTDGDPRAVMNFVIPPTQPAQPINHDALFIGFQNHSTVMICYVPATHSIVRAHHAIIDEFGCTLRSTTRTPAEYLLHHHPTMDLTAVEDYQQLIPPVEIGFADSPFDPNKMVEIQITLPPSSVSDIGLIFEDDVLYGVPMLVDIKPTSPVLHEVPLHFIRRKHHVVSIDTKEPITAHGVYKALADLQRRGRPKQIIITLVSVDKSKYISHYDAARAIHDSMSHRPRV
jgi:hypothetical protein